MEQYAHLLIAADPVFAPSPAKISKFFSDLIRDFRFVYMRSKEEWLPGLQLSKPSGRVRTETNLKTGETFQIPIPAWTELETLSAIEDGLSEVSLYGVYTSGKWTPADLPIALFTPDNEQVSDDHNCIVGCEVRPTAVSTSDWWGDNQSGLNALLFDDPQSPLREDGVFTNPWTDERIIVPKAGHARFWVQFGFGKWLYPRLMNGFEELDPSLVSAAETCFGCKLIQAGRGIG